MRKIIRGADCVCDREYICLYHLKRTWKIGAPIGIILGIITSLILNYIS